MKNSNLKNVVNLLSEELQHVDSEVALYAVKHEPTSLNCFNLKH